VRRFTQIPVYKPFFPHLTAAVGALALVLTLQLQNFNSARNASALE
jgi:hypothetical protein